MIKIQNDYYDARTNTYSFPWIRCLFPHILYCDLKWSTFLQTRRKYHATDIRIWIFPLNILYYIIINMFGYLRKFFFKIANFYVVPNNDFYWVQNKNNNNNLVGMYNNIMMQVLHNGEKRPNRPSPWPALHSPLLVSRLSAVRVNAIHQRHFWFTIDSGRRCHRLCIILIFIIIFVIFCVYIDMIIYYVALHCLNIVMKIRVPSTVPSAEWPTCVSGVSCSSGKGSISRISTWSSWPVCRRCWTGTARITACPWLRTKWLPVFPVAS